MRSEEQVFLEVEQRKASILSKQKIIIVLPAYNAEVTLEKTVKDIPKGFADEIILVDDASTDKTVQVANALGLTVIRHEVNSGYGANQKTCYRLALERGATIVIMIHPDYQYDSRVAPLFSKLISEGVSDIVLGSRVRTKRECLDSGMPFYKYLGNRFLTLLANIVTGKNLSEWHTGYRAYSRNVLEQIPFEENSDDFAFDSQFLVQAAYLELSMADVQVPCRYFPEASSINFFRSLVYGLRTLQVLFQYVLQKTRLMNFKIFT